MTTDKRVVDGLNAIVWKSVPLDDPDREAAVAMLGDVWSVELAKHGIVVFWDGDRQMFYAGRMP